MPEPTFEANVAKDEPSRKLRFIAWLSSRPRGMAPLGTLLVLILFFSLSARHFFSIDTLSSVLRQTPTRAIVGTGLTFVLLCAEIDLSVAMVATFSACQCGVLLH